MALSIQDIDALVSDPTIPAIHAAANAAKNQLPGSLGTLPTTPTPASMGMNDFAASAARARTAAPAFAANRIPSMGEAPNVRGTSAIPSLETSSPTVAKPKESIWKKLEHGLGTAAEVAGDTFVPEVMSQIPGTQLNKEWTARREAAQQEAQASTGLKNAQAQLEKAQAWKAMNAPPASLFEAWERQNPQGTVADWEKFQQTLPATSAFQAWSRENPGAPISQYFAATAAGKPPTPEQDKQWMASAEQLLNKGTLTPQDRERLAGLQRQLKMTGIGPEILSQAGNPPVPADYPKGESDPAYKAANEAWGKRAEELKNQEAGAMGAARGQGYNMSRPVQVLVPQPDGSMAAVYMPASVAEQAGYSVAAAGTKAISQQAQFADINNAIHKVSDALGKVGDTAFTPTQTAKLTLAMQETDPTVMRNEVANLAASGLTPQQQDLVTWLQQLQERALSLRSIAGMGQGSDTTRTAILKALPNITSGNVQMARKQLDALQNMVDNLHRGILNVKGNASGTEGGAPPAGTVEDGYRFKGGDPSKQSNWEKVR